MSTEWTDEKHSLYLNSMEAMFVKQLYNHEYSDMDSQGWRSRRKNQPSPSSSGQSKATSPTSGQFKILQSGCWEKINSLGTQHGLDSANESHVLIGSLRNPHNIGMHPTNLDKSPTFQSDLIQNSDFSYNEVSDQNFVDEDNGPAQKSHLSRKKRMKAKVANAISKDQVVPVARSPITVNTNRHCEGHDYTTKSENMGGKSN